MDQYLKRKLKIQKVDHVIIRDDPLNELIIKAQNRLNTVIKEYHTLKINCQKIRQQIQQAQIKLAQIVDGKKKAVLVESSLQKPQLETDVPNGKTSITNAQLQQNPQLAITTRMVDQINPNTPRRQGDASIVGQLSQSGIKNERTRRIKKRR